MHKWKWNRIFILVLIDSALVNLAMIISLYLRFADIARIPQNYLAVYYKMAIPVTVLYITVFFIFKLYNRVWSYASTGELLSVVYSVTSGALCSIAASFFLAAHFPRGVIILSWAFTVLLVGGSRLAWRLYIDRKRGNGVKPGRKALIVGAGDAGAMVARELNNNPYTNLRAAAFIDDNPSKENNVLLGIPILGGRDQIPSIVAEHGIEEIIIAIPSVRGQALREILEICRKTGINTKILPGVYEIIDGKVSIDRIRPVQVEDLLGRSPVKIDLVGIASYLKNRVVLVTGAGGSIGSELCRQVSSFEPGRLIILGHGENSLHEIWRELLASSPELDIELEIADVRDMPRINYIFQKYRPEVVFHAAAHKHVPLMEMHPLEAIKTNVFGTKNVAEAAHRAGASIFVLISTDKAVNPSSVMGATKRLAEIVIRQLNNCSKTIYTSVRFGNVLGSSGSVITIFKQQIRQGGPVTVTHPEMTRFFMTIPEAVSLVIQSGSMATGGEVFILDMGEPVKIVDLARDMIKFSGYEPGKDIEIIFTGIRPGEKLFEELLTAEEGASTTCHSKIYMARPLLVDATALERELCSLEQLTDDMAGERIFDVLKRVFPGFVDYRKQVKKIEKVEDSLTG